MSYGNDLGITLPTVSITLGPAWATALNAALTSLIGVLETRVTTPGLDINADLSFRSGGSSYRAKDVKAVSFTNQTSALSAGDYAVTLFSSDADGNLYYNDNAGRQVQVTLNGAVNVSTAGGITGAGYGSGSVEVNWDGTDTYHMRLGSAADAFASVKVNDVKLNDGSGNTITVGAPSVASDYTLTLPTAVPAAINAVVAADMSGNLSFTSTPTVGTLTTTGAVTAVTLAVSSTSALSGTLTMAVDKDIVLSGTGKIVHGTRTLVLPGMAFKPTTNVAYTVTGSGQLTGSSAADWICYLPLPAGTRITHMTWYVNQSGGVGGTRTFDVKTIPADGGSTTTIESDSSSSSSSALIIASSTDIDISSSNYYFLVWDCTDGDILRSVVVTYNTPA